MRQPCFERSKHVDRLEVNAYFGRSKMTLLNNFILAMPNMQNVFQFVS